jgi:hypothetical protein
MNHLAVIHPVLALLMAPLLFGVINRTKAVFAGRTGQPLLQAYFDLFKLLCKGAVYGRTTSWIFRAGPVVGLSSILVALLVVPFAGIPAILHFGGDLLLLAYALGLMRFFTVLAALDTGSAFEGMGASREVQFSALAEPTLLLGLAAIARETVYAAGPFSSNLGGRGPCAGNDRRFALRNFTRRECEDPRGRSDHTSGTHDDSRSDGARSLGSRFCIHPVFRGFETLGIECLADWDRLARALWRSVAGLSGRARRNDRSGRHDWRD